MGLRLGVFFIWSADRWNSKARVQ